jgi:hypothetical protein
MSDRDERIAGVLGRLNHVTPRGLLPLLLDEVGRPEAGATGLRLFVADVEERVLNVWGAAGVVEPGDESVPVEGSDQGDVYRGRPMRRDRGGRAVVLAPVSARGERIGVVELTAEGSTVSTDSAEEAAVVIGLLVGMFVITADQWTDEFHVARRRKDMSLAAEVQWNTLPLASFAGDGVSLAGALEPAYDIGGDAFDYAYGRNALWVGIFDAMGHGLAAARVSSLAVSAFRNARRRGEDLEVQARFIDGAIRDLVDWGGFVTGQLLRVDVSDPTRTTLINAGHPPPILQRGHEAPELLRPDVHLPFGIPSPNPLGEQRVPLGPGDRLILYSDGLVDARPDGGEAYGTERVLGGLPALRSLPPRETARRLVADVRRHRATFLADDASVLVIDLPAS